MIVIHGGVRVDPAKVEAITALAATFVAEVAKEDGFIEYTLSWDVAEPNRLRLLEVWDSAESSAAHGTQPHVAAWTTEITAAAIEAPEFHRYELAEA